MNMQNGTPRGTKVLPAARITAIREVEAAYQTHLRFLKDQFPEEVWRNLNKPLNFSPEQEAAIRDQISKFPIEAVKWHDEWMREGRPTLVPERSVEDVMADLGIGMPSEPGDSHLPAVGDSNVSTVKPPIEKPAPVKSTEDGSVKTAVKPRMEMNARMNLAMMLANRDHGKSWDALDARRQEQVLNEAAEMIAMVTDSISMAED